MEENREENSLTTERADAYRLDAELRNHADNVVGEMIGIGKCLKQISERKLYQFLGTGTFAEYAEKAVGLKERAAYNYITAYETYGEKGLQKYGGIGITKLVQLAQLNDSDREEMLESGKAAELSSRELKEQIKELKGQNDQLRFEFADAETAAKNNAEQLAELRKTVEAREKEAEELKKQLAEAQRPVVASLTDEEKDDIRREAEKKAGEEAEKKAKAAIAEAEKNAKESADKKIDKLKAEKEAALRETEQAKKEQEAKINELTASLESLKVQNEQLQANAEKAKRPPITGSKEALKFCLEDVQQQFTRSVELVGTMEGEEKAKFKAALVGIAEKLKAAAEGIA